VYRAGLLSILLVSSLACAQVPAKSTSRPDPPPVKLKVTKAPRWKGDCLELTVQVANISKLDIFLDATYGGIKVYSSVNDATNMLGQGAGEAWMLLYGWTDVVSEPIRLAPGARRASSLCIAETFPVKMAGKDVLRQVRVRGKLRIVASYEIPEWRIIHQPQGKGRGSYVRMVDYSSRWTRGEVSLEIPISCPNDSSTSDCLSPPQIFPGEHDVYPFQLEPPSPPVIETQPPPLPALPIDRPPRRNRVPIRDKWPIGPVAASPQDLRR
jgi:hypothetical protein